MKQNTKSLRIYGYMASTENDADLSDIDVLTAQLIVMDTYNDVLRRLILYCLGSDC